MRVVDLGCGSGEDASADMVSAFSLFTHLLIERNAIDVWAGKLGLVVEKFVDSGFPSWEGHALGQSVVILRKTG